jgi:hypothetical protein
VIIGEGLPFIKKYIQSINETLKRHDPEKALTALQCYWLSFVILGILVTNSVCWKKFERYSLGQYAASSISFMFRRAKIAWDWLLLVSTMYIIKSYKIQLGSLVIDDSDIERSKNATKLGKLHKIRDKKRSGFFVGQNIIFLLLVTKEYTLPVGFNFYEPDPDVVKWRKQEKILKEKKVAKEHRPPAPPKNPNYPSKKQVALDLLRNFVMNFNDIKIKAVVFDNLYSSKEFIEAVAELTKQKQVITQIKQNQLINVNGKYIQIQDFFSNYSGKTITLNLRGKEKVITYCGGKFKVKSLEKKYYVIALKYDNEASYRYLIAHDSSWRDVDIIEKYSYRWLVEVFIQDWKSYEGFEQLAKQPGIDGSERGVILSLLCDHALLVHEEQEVLFKNNESAVTVGSLRERVMMQSLVSFVEEIVMSANPIQKLKIFSEQVTELFELRTSCKHLRHVDMDKISEAA